MTNVKIKHKIIIYFTGAQMLVHTLILEAQESGLYSICHWPNFHHCLYSVLCSEDPATRRWPCWRADISQMAPAQLPYGEQTSPSSPYQTEITDYSSTNLFYFPNFSRILLSHFQQKESVGSYLPFEQITSQKKHQTSFYKHPYPGIIFILYSLKIVQGI